MVDASTASAPPVQSLRLPLSHSLDVAKGTSSELIAEGLVALHELPGQPGRGKCMCTYLDGVPIAKGSGNGKNPSHQLPGYRQITRVGADRYRIHLSVDREVAEQRCKAETPHGSAFIAGCRAALAHDWRIRVGKSRADLVARRAHLQLVARA